MEQNLNLYQVFYEVANCRNFSIAAKKMFITQPAVSKSVSNLEDNLQITLFHRSSRGVTLTPEGEILYNHVRDALNSLKFGEELMRNLSRENIIHLTIGVSTTLCKYVLLPRLKSFIAENPNIKIQISCQSTYDTLSSIEDGSIDLGFVGLSGQNEKVHSSDAITSLPIATIEDIFVSTDTYLNSLQSKNTGEMILQGPFLKEASFIMLNKENISRKHADSFLNSHKLTLHNIIEVNNMDLAIEFAKAGLGISCVISDFVRKDLNNGTLKEIKLGYRIPKRQIGFVYRNNTPCKNAIDKLVMHYQI